MLRLPGFDRAGCLFLLALFLVALLPASLPAFHERGLRVAAGDVTGSDYPAAGAIAKVFNRKGGEHGMRLATLETQGALENIDAVVLGKAAFGIAQADMLERARQGRGPRDGKPQPGLRAVLGLHVEAITVVARTDLAIHSVSDLRGKRVNVGALGSSDHEYAGQLLEADGISPAALTLFQFPVRLASGLLQRDEADAYIHAAGHPNLSLLDASGGKRAVQLIPVDGALLERATARNPLLFPTQISTGFYPALGGQGAVPTIGVRAVLFTRDDMTEETVYRLVREVLVNFDLLRSQHPLLQHLTPQESCRVATTPLHSGAERACREMEFAP
jgi:TRAP transporter TAXI family solute receptor